MKFDKRIAYESSRSKRAVYSRLLEAMTAIATRLHQQEGGGAAKGGRKRGGKTLMEMVEENLKEESPEKKSKTSGDAEEEVKEDFEEWKRKILQNANSNA